MAGVKVLIENQIQSYSIKRWSLGQRPLYLILTSWIVQGHENRLIFINVCLSYIFNWILFLFSLTSFFIIFWFLVKPVTCIFILWTHMKKHHQRKSNIFQKYITLKDACIYKINNSVNVHTFIFKKSLCMFVIYSPQYHDFWVPHTHERGKSETSNGLWFCCHILAITFNPEVSPVCVITDDITLLTS